MLTQEQVDAYGQCDAMCCPVCGSENIEADPVEFGDGVMQSNTCLDCGATWTDNLVPESVTDDEGDEYTLLRYDPRRVLLDLKTRLLARETVDLATIALINTMLAELP